uniref:Uncharacterized protein n=1 Tax=Amphimedon queenslandica TaxID=400682 RepID=A0A1X7TY61_AMPQE
MSGERISAIACMSMNGLLDIKLGCETTDGDEYYEFVQTHLLPHLLPLMDITIIQLLWTTVPYIMYKR